VQATGQEESNQEEQEKGGKRNSGDTPKGLVTSLVVWRRKKKWKKCELE